MSDYRDYKKVLRVNIRRGYRMFLQLDCGHEVYRYGKVTPKKVRCEYCEIERRINDKIHA